MHTYAGFTTVDEKWEAEAIAHHAVRMLLECIEGTFAGEPRTYTVQPPELVVYA